jgi:hypothetical protein
MTRHVVTSDHSEKWPVTWRAVRSLCVWKEGSR